MTIREIIKEASSFLNSREIEDPSYEAGLLLSWVIKRELSFIYANQDYSLPEGDINSLWAVVERRGNHEPFAYITGECEFLSLPFYVSPDVLIPRADTEILAEAALFSLGKGPAMFNQKMWKLENCEEYTVLDIGTGSGCLAVSIAKNVSTCRVDAIDISQKAITMAQRNAERNCVADRIKFINQDFLAEYLILPGPYNLIVSNPPYIPDSDIPGLMSSVKDYEPYTALSGGCDGLVFYRDLANKAEALLKPSGIIAVECGIDQASQICDLFKAKGMETLTLKDLPGIERVVAARKV